MAISLEPIKAQIAALKAAGAPQITPDAWKKLTDDFAHALAELEAAKADNRITILEAIGLARDAITLAGDISAIVTELFPVKAA